MPTYDSPQENFWAGEFGDAYIERNASDGLLAGSIMLFSDVLKHTQSVASVLEIGSNYGLNLRALNTLLPQAHLTGLEINKKAFDILDALPFVDARQGSAQSFDSDEQWDLTFTRGVLIHINPDDLPTVYHKLYTTSKRYILIAEYYSQHPQALPYRGHEDRLYKRDFAGEMMDQFPDLNLLGYGFQYHRDPAFALADISWFMMEKPGHAPETSEKTDPC